MYYQNFGKFFQKQRGPILTSNSFYIYVATEKVTVLIALILLIEKRQKIVDRKGCTSTV